MATVKGMIEIVGDGDSEWVLIGMIVTVWMVKIVIVRIVIVRGW